MANEQDPPSTRCTFVLTSDHQELFDMGAPGDRVELVEQAQGRAAVRVVTARILHVRTAQTSTAPLRRG